MSMGDQILDTRIETAIKKTYQAMVDNNQLIELDKLNQFLSSFQERFGPDQLMKLDGETLLTTMHANGKESMVRWLEFKDDDQFRTYAFGGIGGGSALNYGLYERTQDGAWIIGSSNKQTEISVAQAIEIAANHRDQLIAGLKLMEALPDNASETEYQELQNRLSEDAPDVFDKAWGHKYFTQLYPSKLETYHVESFQLFHLIKLLQIPPEGKGRYISAGRFVKLAKHLGIPLIHLVQVLNQVNGRPYKVWRIGTMIGEESIWPVMQENSYVSIGWSGLGDLSALKHNKESRDFLSGELSERYEYVPNLASRKAGEILNFVTGVTERDLVLPADGLRVLSIGRVTGPYRYEPGKHGSAPHNRPVEWIYNDQWGLPVNEGLNTTVFQIRKNHEILVEAERLALSGPDTIVGPPQGHSEGQTLQPLTGHSGRIQSVLDRKGQVILYGPPGTGKTYWAFKTARELASRAEFNLGYEDLDTDQRSRIDGGDSHGLIRKCTFHPSYGYEDFMEGYRPDVSETGQLVFRRASGIFKSICADASENSDSNYYLVIDEINRGDIPRIFGELLTLLEKDKRGESVILSTSSERFSVPPNVFILGTMNTADRSIALLDTALRRRFGFIELMPELSALPDAPFANGISIRAWLSELNGRILKSIGRDSRNRQIGHAYLMDSGKDITDFRHFTQILSDDIIPLLQEYCYEDYHTLAQILGNVLIDENRQCIRQELFLPVNMNNLRDALFKPDQEITTEADTNSNEGET